MPTLETLAAAALLREHLPELKVRVVNVVDLMRLQPESEHPHGLSDREFDALFTHDRPVVFAYHGYPWLIHRLTYRRTNHDNLHVRGYKEEGTTTTPFDMVMLNDLDRFHLVIDVIDRVPGLADPRGARCARRWTTARLRARAYTREHGEDDPGDPRLDLAVLSVRRPRRQRRLDQPEAVASSTTDESAATVDVAGRGAERSSAVAHRVVHGGARFREPVVIDDGVRARARAARRELAPLHNAPALARDRRGAASAARTSRTSRSSTRPSTPRSRTEASTYALPRRWREEWGIRRYGFHGLSVAVGGRARAASPRLVVCHLGGGCSVTAVLRRPLGRHDDGLQPARGRADGDALGLGRPRLAALPAAARGSTPTSSSTRSSTSRACSASAARRSVEELEASRGARRAARARGLRATASPAAVAAMAAALGGLDALVFTAGVGEGSALVRARVCARLAFLGVELDPSANASAEPDADVAAAGSAVRVGVVRAREDVVAARAARSTRLVPVSAAGPEPLGQLGDDARLRHRGEEIAPPERVEHEGRLAVEPSAPARPTLHRREPPVRDLLRDRAVPRARRASAPGRAAPASLARAGSSPSRQTTP